MKFIKRIFKIIFQSKKTFFIQSDKNSYIKIDPTATIKNSHIVITNGNLIVEEGVKIQNVNIRIEDGSMKIGKNSILEQGDNYRRPTISIEVGSLTITNNVSFRADVLIRFGGELYIGEYTAINERTVLRCDENINIGSFCMISYDCLIFDTNTHEILPLEERRKMTLSDYPLIGKEINKPITKIITIKDDCWVGQRCSILKGANMEKGSILALGSTLTGHIPQEQVAAGNPAVVKNNKNRLFKIVRNNE